MKQVETTIEVNLARVRKVQDYIQKHYGEDLTLATLAEHVNLVPTSLCHVFKRVTGQRVSDYLIQTRINHAAKLLRETSMEVKAITYACGFSTQTNFNRQFKRLMGCTPTEYRFQKKNYNQ